MEEQHYTEIKDSVQLANGGNWFPIATLGLCFTLIIALLVAFWKKSEKDNDKRHTQNEKLIATLTDNQKKIGEVLVELKTNTKVHDRQITENRQDIKKILS